MKNVNIKIKVVPIELMIMRLTSMTGPIAVFWSIWYKTTGSIPIAYGIPRWWDICLGPIGYIIFKVFFEKLKEDRDDLFLGLIAFLAVGVIAGLLNGIMVFLCFVLLVLMVLVIKSILQHTVLPLKR